MISLTNGGITSDPAHLRAKAFQALQRWARATAEDKDQLTEILGPTEDTPANRKLLAKILRNLAGPTPPTP